MTETKSPDIGRIYQNLRIIEGSLGGTVPAGDLAQEILDFLAMASGLKPALLLGRGLDSPEWLASTTALAAEFEFHVLAGPLWDATPFGKFPDWYRDHALTQLAPFHASYVCTSPETAQEIGAINEAGGRLSMSTEARLLGYPVCCVVAHYDRAVRYHQAIFSILRRLSGGDDARMQALLRGGAALTPKTQAEIAHMAAAFDLQPAPFGSWNQCPHCARNAASPSADLSHKYKALAEATDAEWFRTLLGM